MRDSQNARASRRAGAVQKTLAGLAAVTTETAAPVSPGARGTTVVSVITAVQKSAVKY